MAAVVDSGSEYTAAAVGCAAGGAAAAAGCAVFAVRFVGMSYSSGSAVETWRVGCVADAAAGVVGGGVCFGVPAAADSSCRLSPAGYSGAGDSARNSLASAYRCWTSADDCDDGCSAAAGGAADGDA